MPEDHPEKNGVPVKMEDMVAEVKRRIQEKEEREGVERGLEKVKVEEK